MLHSRITTPLHRHNHSPTDSTSQHPHTTTPSLPQALHPSSLDVSNSPHRLSAAGQAPQLSLRRPLLRPRAPSSLLAPRGSQARPPLCVPPLHHSSAPLGAPPVRWALVALDCLPLRLLLRPPSQPPVAGASPCSVATASALAHPPPLASHRSPLRSWLVPLLSRSRPARHSLSSSSPSGVEARRAVAWSRPCTARRWSPSGRGRGGRLQSTERSSHPPVSFLSFLLFQLSPARSSLSRSSSSEPLSISVDAPPVCVRCGYVAASLL